MTTENRASTSTSTDVDARADDGSTLASRMKLRKLTAAKTQQQTTNVTKRSASSSEYFASNSRTVVEKAVCKRKRAAKTLPDAANSEKSSISGNDGSAVVDRAKSARRLRGKRQSTETAKREAHKKRDESEFVSTTDVDDLVSRQQQKGCNESCSFDAEASPDDNNNNSSSSDVDWEDVEGN